MYKVLKRQVGKLKSPFQGMEYEPNKLYTCEDFCTDKSLDCAEGYYATDVDGLIYSFRNLPEYEVWECEVGGRKVELDQFKRRYEKIKLIRHVPNNEVKKLALEVETEVGYKLSEALFPINPLEIQRNNPPTEEELLWLEEWVSVRNSVRNSMWNIVRVSVGNSVGSSVWNSVWDSVWDSVGDSVGDGVWDSVWNSVWNFALSVWDSVWNSVWNSVRDSVWDSVYAYISGLFPNIKNWKYIDHPEGVNPLQPGINLWKAGLVPSYDGKKWRLHAGKNAEVVWEEKT